MRAAVRLQLQRPACLPVAPYEQEAACRYLLKNLVRDWAKEGAPERSQSYRKICQELKARFSGRASDQPCPHVLVPGAGLGRLCLDIAAEGFAAQVSSLQWLLG